MAFFRIRLELLFDCQNSNSGSELLQPRKLEKAHFEPGIMIIALSILTRGNLLWCDVIWIWWVGLRTSNQLTRFYNRPTLQVLLAGISVFMAFFRVRSQLLLTVRIQASDFLQAWKLEKARIEDDFLGFSSFGLNEKELVVILYRFDELDLGRDGVLARMWSNKWEIFQ